MGIEVFHTCKELGDKDTVLNSAPFLSEDCNRQWLTQGFYFWVEDIELAHHWGNNSIQGGYAILSAELVIDKDKLLDLVASPNDIKHFRNILSKYMNIMKQRFNKRYDPTISECIAHFRKIAVDNIDVFPYIAIIASEETSGLKRKFINNKSNCIALNNRIQICLFDGNTQSITKKSLVYPDKWVK